MLTYLFIGLFVGAINVLWKVYLESINQLSTPPSVLIFLVASVVWPLTIYAMIKKGIDIGSNSGS